VRSSSVGSRFRHVYINGTILDKQGRKMSKSLGNGIDPVLVIEGGHDETTGKDYKPHGADAVRYSLATLTVEGQDLKLSAEAFAEGQRFVTKLWNAGRFALGHLAGGAADVAPSVDPARLRLEDRWILERLAAAIEETTASLEGFRYCEAAQRVRSFARDEFCDWYVEAVKFRFAAGDEGDAKTCRRVLASTLDALLRLLHPVCPFITEEIWQLLGQALEDRSLDGRGGGRAAESIMIATWPAAAAIPRDPDAAESFSRLQEIVTRIRKVRQERNLTPQNTPEAILSAASPSDGEVIFREATLLKNLASLEKLTPGAQASRPAACAVEVLAGLEIVVPLPAADASREIEALEKELERLASYIQREEARLANPSFAAKAPADVVDAARKRVESSRAQLRPIEEQITRLRGSGPAAGKG
jgi:valyl-tRNA synthetase